MTVTSFPALQRWFENQSRGEKASPHWTLYAVDYGQKDTRVIFNDRLDDMGASFEFLVNSIRDLNNPQGTKFRIQTYAPKGHNNPTGNVLVQIYENGNAPLGGNQNSGIAGIGAPLVGYIPEELVEIKIAGALAQAHKEWELNQRLKEMEDRLNAPPDDMVEKITATVERISQTPMGAALIGMLAAKMGVSPAALMAPAMNGTPATADEDPPGPDEEEFFDNMEATANKLGVTEHVLARKLRELVTANPEMAKQLLA